MESIQIKNLRCFEDTGEVNLDKLNVFVGKNASGKSTLARFFPLLKQTIESKTSEPILWYGNYVDFGDFEEALSNGKEGSEMEISFKLNLNLGSLYYFSSYYFNEMDNFTKTTPVKITLKLSKNFIPKISVYLYGHALDLNFNLDEGHVYLENAVINNELFNFEDKYYFEEPSAGFIPILHSKDSYHPLGSKEETFEQRIFKISYSTLRKLAKSKSGDGTLHEVLYPIILATPEEMKNRMLRNSMGIRSTSKIRKFFETCDENELLPLINTILLRYAPDLLENINYQLIKEISLIQYIAPLRAVAERYYRNAGLSLKEIDPKGENIPMYLFKLHKNNELKKFNKWLNDNFKISLKIIQSKGHLSINIEDSNSEQVVNLADTGFGYSQLLPILILIWESVQRKSREPDQRRKFIDLGIPKTIVMEQPELHIHPAIQAKMIDSISSILAIAEKEKLDIKFILETHSETIVRRIGYLIAKNKLNHDYVNIYIFDQKNGISNIKRAHYNERGNLKNWPLGFFTPEGF
ncbi:AAA family ATPase [Methanococcus maripaludis]|uniref:Putative ATPase n=1 Tax=Methanococcus maripaludis TaxID=39152 RepID=A0A7J9PTS4_METMI|nr:AAA family ATPase [Methanococcus maripaludis]MBA2868941.1 putative ATPase [Methanococcus maripaludis]